MKSFESKKDWLLYLEELLGPEGSSDSANLMAEYLNAEYQMSWENVDENQTITDEMFIESLGFIMENGAK